MASTPEQNTSFTTTQINILTALTALRDKCGDKKAPFTVEEMETIPPESNPFHYDLYNMGQQMGDNLMVMFGNHTNEHCDYLILLNTQTGKRIKIHI